MRHKTGTTLSEHDHPALTCCATVTCAGYRTLFGEEARSPYPSNESQSVRARRPGCDPGRSSYVGQWTSRSGLSNPPDQMGVEDGRIAYEHIYWDQVTVSWRSGRTIRRLLLVVARAGGIAHVSSRSTSSSRPTGLQSALSGRPLPDTFRSTPLRSSSSCRFPTWTSRSVVISPSPPTMLPITDHASTPSQSR